MNGNVVCKFFEYTTLHADGNIYFGSSLNSNLSSYGEIISYGKKGGIIGGSCYAEKGYCLTNIGNAVGIGTTLLLGTNENIHLQQMTLDQEISKIKNNITRLTTAYEDACKKIPGYQNKKTNLLLKLQDAIYIQNNELEAALLLMGNHLPQTIQHRPVFEGFRGENLNIHPGMKHRRHKLAVQKTLLRGDELRGKHQIGQ